MFMRRGQFIAFEPPVPRWSTKTRSCVSLKTRKVFVAHWTELDAAPPGPPAK